MAELRGSCLCGAVRFEVAGPLAQPVACHCVQCRKGSGHFTASTWAPRAAVKVWGELRWYEYKPGARRGFCPNCGAAMFWETARDPDNLSIEMGAFDGPTGLRLARHMFTAEKGDYYALGDGLPGYPGDLEAEG
ncbi:MAG TPA: GFA family protein [Paracoccaceae bacterium]|nr:GFA family protein [Paracoccaceae bacterium]